jgi:hypothetical protein
MVERRALTPKFVCDARPPDKGERWVADTKVRGLGLRLWATKSGAAKAFAIRVSDKRGQHLRLTYNVERNWRLRFAVAYSGFENTYGLGDSLEDARDWAREEINRIKGRATLQEQDDDQLELHKAAVRKLTFERAALSMLEGMRGRGLSEAYISRIDKLFATKIPDTLKQVPLSRLSPKLVANALVTQNAAPANIRILRSFIGQIFEQGALFDGKLLLFSKALSVEFWKKWEEQIDVRFPELNKFEQRDYEIIFTELEAERTRWQQAFCIRLFFEFGAPLTRLMSARWTQILDQSWYPYDPTEKIFWFESNERVTPIARSLLKRARKYSRQDFAGTPYWFPSQFGRRVEHIRSVEYMWRTALERCGSRFYPLREFALSYRRPTTPSYILSFLRRYGTLLRQAENVAEVSKTLLERKNIPLISKT